MSVSLAGLISGLLSPLAMTIGFFVWDKSWKGSPYALNLYKCSLASILFLAVALGIHAGKLDPSTGYAPLSVGVLIISSIIGIVFGDFVWLRALQLLGARRVILVDSLKPLFGAVLGRIFLDEYLVPFMLFGIVLTLSGILVVSLESSVEDGKDTKESAEMQEIERKGSMQEIEGRGSISGIESIEDMKAETGNDDSEDIMKVRKGWLMAVANVFVDGVGFMLTKLVGREMTTIDINLIRFGFAAACMLSLTCCLTAWRTMKLVQKLEPNVQSGQKGVVEGENAAWWQLPRNMTKNQWYKVSVGVLFVTFFAPLLSNYALFKLHLSLCMTLLSFGPIYALPLGRIMKNELITWRATLGATLAVAGVVALAFSTDVDDNRF